MMACKGLRQGFLSLIVIIGVACYSLSALATAKYDPNKDYLFLVSPHSDSGFGGYYLDIEATMSEFNISRLKAHEIQNGMRDNLEDSSGSYSRVTQTHYLVQALTQSLEDVLIHSINEGDFSPINFKQGEFIVVLDMDETLLTHWYQYGTENGGDIGTLNVPYRDSSPSWVDRKTGNSTGEPLLLLSPDKVQIRPGVEQFLQGVSQLPGFKGFVLFTAKEDNSAWSLYTTWLAQNPQIFSNVLGFYTRNYLRFDANLKKPSKDLRMFDPSLKHVLLVDDNESRVMQKNLNYRIPKFNADSYIEATLVNIDPDIEAVHDSVLAHTGQLISDCVFTTVVDNALDPKVELSSCFESNIGNLSQHENGEIKALIEYLDSQNIPHASEEELAEMFHQEFVYEYFHYLMDTFPEFRDFKMVN